MKWIGLFLLFVFSVTVRASDEIIQLTEEGVSASLVPSEARTECLKSAIDKGTLNAISNIIGTSRAEKNMAQIKEKVLSESSKFIQYYKATEPIKTNDQTSLTVTMKISIAGLREILDREGLLIQNEEVFSLLPLIKIYEKKSQGRHYSWWKDEAYSAPAVMKEQAKYFSNQWLGFKGFKMMDPLGLNLNSAVSERFKHDALSVEEAVFLGQEFKAQIVLLGDIAILPSDKPDKMKAMIKLYGYNVANSRLLVDLTKAMEITSKKSNSDLVLQQVLRTVFSDISKSIYSDLQLAFKRGNFGTVNVSFIFKGGLGYQDLENIKKQLLLKIPEMRTLRERRLERGRVTLEGDVVGGVSQIVKKLESSKFENFEIFVENVTSEQVDLRWNKTKGN